MEVAADVIAGDVVGQDALKRSHDTAGVGVALRDRDRIDTAVKNFRLIIEPSPRLSEDRLDLPFKLLGTQ